VSDNETPVTNNSGSASEFASAPEDLADMNEETVEVSAPSEEVGMEAENNHQEANELEVLRVEATKNLEGWQRTLAEFQNYKRRVEREQKDLRH
jgi:molecular chaperone GrpE (heat shock protein)